ncbi:MAG: preprotein translocase subunit SecG [Spirochaetaceae bacterium]|nr:preprotein translocase subunit SecG [Spirochaetaceae bacterium]
MAILSVLLLVMFIIACIFLVLMVLIQNDQGEGIGGLFGGGGGASFGSRSGNVLTKFTSILAAVFFITSFGLAWVNRTIDRGDILGAAHRQGAGQTEAVQWWNPVTPTADAAIDFETEENDRE